MDDDAKMRESIERLLNAAGCECGAYISAEALLADGSRPHASCIVSDLKLPCMSGLDLLEQLRGRGDSTPFVLITAHDAPGLREQALKRGAAAYLAKPFRGTALLETIGRVALPALSA